MGLKIDFFFDLFVINIFLTKIKKNRIRKIDLFDHFILYMEVVLPMFMG